MAKRRPRKLRHMGFTFGSTRQGRTFIICHQGCEPYAVAVVRELYGRYPEKGEHIHHINGDCGDDRPQNLVILRGRDHMRFHRLTGLLTTPGTDWRTTVVPGPRASHHCPHCGLPMIARWMLCPACATPEARIIYRRDYRCRRYAARKQIQREAAHV